MKPFRKCTYFNNDTILCEKIPNIYIFLIDDVLFFLKSLIVLPNASKSVIPFYD